MADVKVSQLPEASSADPGDFFLLSDTSGAVSKKIDALNVATGADKGALSATLISADSDNVIVQGSDNLLYSTVQDPDVTAATLISADADNVIVQGSDDLLYSSVQDGSITAAKLADDAVTTDKILDGAITLDKLDPSAIGGLPVGAIANIASATLSAPQSNIDIVLGDTSTYSAVLVYFSSSPASQIWVRYSTDGGSTFATTGYVYAYKQTNGNSSTLLQQKSGNPNRVDLGSSDAHGSFSMVLSNLSSTTQTKTLTFSLASTEADGSFYRSTDGMGAFRTTSVVNALKIGKTAGTFPAGTTVVVKGVTL